MVQVRGTSGKLVKCVRLLNVGEVQEEDANDEESSNEGGKSHDYDYGQNVDSASGPEHPPHMLKGTISIQRQILDLVDATGTGGTTLNVSTLYALLPDPFEKLFL